MQLTVNKKDFYIAKMKYEETAGEGLFFSRRLTYVQIAQMEGCKKQSVCESVFLAEEKIK